MGTTNICKDVCFEAQNQKDTLQVDFKNKSRPGSSESVPAADEKQKPTQERPLRSGSSKKVTWDIQKQLGQLPSRLINESKVTQMGKVTELGLTVDERWLQMMRSDYQDPIEILDVYRQVNVGHNLDNNRLILRRVSNDNRKVQLLFKQHVPMLGKHYFEIQLLSYLPKHKCDFTVGIVDYFQARKNVHSRDKCIEQSYTYIQRSQLKEGLENVPVKVNKVFRIEVSRWEKQPFVAFYIDKQLVKREQLRPDLLEKITSIVPYLQTQFEGVQFAFTHVQNNPKTYQMNQITEERASSIEASQ